MGGTDGSEFVPGSNPGGSKIDAQPIPTPEPIAPPSPPSGSESARKNFQVSLVISSLGSSTLIASLLIGYDQFARPREEPYKSPLATAAKEYKRTLPDAYHQAAERVKVSVLSSKDDVVKELQQHAQPLASALDQAFVPLIDDKGKITNARAAADQLEETSKALK